MRLSCFFSVYLDSPIIKGTAILLKPGIIAGGSVLHDCPLSRSIGYFLEPVVMLAPFAKKSLQLTLRGITSDDKDLSVRHEVEVIASVSYSYFQADLIRTVTLPHLQLFGISEGLEMRVCPSMLCLQVDFLITGLDKKARKRSTRRW